MTIGKELFPCRSARMITGTTVSIGAIIRAIVSIRPSGRAAPLSPLRAHLSSDGSQWELSHLEKEHTLQVLVRDNNVEQALKALKKKMQREGIFREMKRRSAYEKPSETKVREKAEGIRRARKQARKQAQREGLVARPKPKPAGAAPRRRAIALRRLKDGTAGQD